MPPHGAAAQYHTEKLTTYELGMVLSSADWQGRMVDIAANSGVFVQNTTKKLKPLRLKSMERDREPVVNSDVAFVHDVAEKQWVDDFNYFISDPKRAASAKPFDPSLLFNLPAFGFENSSGRKRKLPPSRDRHMERVARSSHGRWIAACDADKIHLLSPAQKHSWPSVPSVWRDKEVPFRLWAGTPLVVRTHGLLMARYPFSSANPLSSDSAARAHACWCAAATQAVQLACSALIDECFQHGRLFWLTDDLRFIIRRMGADKIIGSGPGAGDMLAYMIDSIEQVRWDMVDPCGCQTASNTAHGTTVFISGDAVSWDQSRRTFGELAIVSSMRISPKEITVRGKRLFGRMVPMGRREPLEGYGTRLPEWRGVPVEEMRQGGPESWELYSAGHHQEHLNRLEGSSGTMNHKKLLASNAHRNSRNTPQKHHGQPENPTSELEVNPRNISVADDLEKRDSTNVARTNQGSHTLDRLSSFTDEEQQVLGVKFLSAFLQMMDTHKDQM